MKPAASVILLTTLIGAGQGLFLALYSQQFYALFSLVPRQGADFYGYGSVLVVALLVAGLIASFFHLGHPERAWRTASQWRTSWLSREVIVLPVFTGIVVLYALAHWLWNPVLFSTAGGYGLDLSLLLGAIGVVFALGLFVCTGMIYACLRFLREWHTPLTIINYILLGCASGFTLAMVYAMVSAPDQFAYFGGWALLFTLLGLVGRGGAVRRNARLRAGSTVQSALGIRHSRIVQKSQGAMGGSFNTKEFFHGRSAAWYRMIRPAFFLLAFILPLVLLMVLMTGTVRVSLALVGLVFVLQYVGLLAERWYFFAEARHPQNLYYQTIG